MDFSRRTALQGALAAVAVAGKPALAITGTAIPPGPMRLVRRLERGLSDGEAIIVERCWGVAFSHGAAGIAISGEQLSASVDAPPALAQLAQIEEGRDTSAMFPILLASDGDILDSGSTNESTDMAEAVRLAKEMIARSGGDEAGHARHLAAIQAAGVRLLDTMPRDLFFPKNTSWARSRTIDLPGGAAGQFSVSYLASRGKAGPWLERAERVVTTTLAESSRVSREIWTLESA